MDPLQKRIEGVSAHKFKGDYLSMACCELVGIGHDSQFGDYAMLCNASPGHSIHRRTSRNPLIYDARYWMFMSVLEAVCLVVLVLIGAGDCRG